MKCPRCVQKVTPAAASCPHCGYALGAARVLYGNDAVVVERLMDVEGAMEAKTRAEVLEAIGEFDERFPQLFLLVYVGPLPPPASPRQFAFWLLNHAAVANADAFHPNERGLLLVIDPKAGTAVLTAGYCLEPLMHQDELDSLLRQATRDFAKADYRSAVRSLTAGLAKLLEQRVREARKNPGAFGERPIAPDNFPPLIRTGEVSVPEPQSGEAGSHGTAPQPGVEASGVSPTMEEPSGPVAGAADRSAGRKRTKGQALRKRANPYRP